MMLRKVYVPVNLPSESDHRIAFYSDDDRLRQGRTVFERPKAASFTADFSSACVGVERLRLGNGGAIRENVGAFITASFEAERVDPGIFRAGSTVS